MSLMKHSGYMLLFSHIPVLALAIACFSSTLFASSQLKEAPPVDLEADIQDFVLDTKRIFVPGYPLAFNPSVISWKGALLMSFRIIPNRASSFTSLIGLAWLDNDFNVIGEPQILDLRKGNPVPSRAEDARLVAVDGRLYMVYDDNAEEKISRKGFRVYVAELSVEESLIVVKSTHCLEKFEGESSQKREKSWVPFDYHSELLLAYSINPHLIFYPHLSAGACETVARSESSIIWHWGELRGGTPALRLDDGRYLSFFHSSRQMPSVQSKGENILHYFMGAYTFDGEFPFALDSISPKPIVGKNFYEGEEYKPYWKPVKAVFPCGYAADEQFIWIVYGRDDHESWVVKLDKAGLLHSLKSLKTKD